MQGVIGIHNPNFMRKGFSIVELIIVVVIVGILSTFAVPQFAVTKERTLDNEAIALLGLIRAAERAYRMEESTYYPSVGSDSAIATINSNLRLSLPATSSWTYIVASTGISTATRTGGPRTPRVWSLNASAACEKPTCNGAGCFGAGGC